MKEGRKLIKTNKIYAFIQATQLTDEKMQEQISNWFALVRLSFTPTSYYLNQKDIRSYNIEEVRSLLERSVDEVNFELILTDGQNESSIHVVQEAVLQRHLFTFDVFQQARELLLSYMDTTMAQGGLFGYIRPYDEFLNHNVESIEKRKEFQSSEEIAELPKRKSHGEEIVVDCNQFAGYDVFYNGFCLTSCWRMYFSEYYERILPLVIIKDAQQVEQIKTLESGIVMVELYQDPYHWDYPTNLSYQRLFRDQVGIDQLTWDNGVGILREPLIEYAFGNQLIQTIQYQNNRLQPTVKRKATHFVTRNFDLVNEIYQERRVYGLLNAQAYFPWIDQSAMRMMDYIILKPQFTLDNGLEAYEFYIRNHLEVNYTREHFEEYTVCLQFYLPKEAMENLPIDALKDRMLDIHFGFLHRSKKSVWVNLKKDGHHLRIYFMNMELVAEQQPIPENR
jgi:hypothetical protein